MAKQKRLNTNLVAFLTVMGMIVTVSVVGLIIWQGTQRDPEALAQEARERAEAGDLVMAARNYLRAYRASDDEEPKYLLSSANCWLELGEIGTWSSVLREAHTAQPSDPIWLAAILEGMWQIQEIRGRGLGPDWEQSRRDDADALLALRENDPLALASKALALWNLGGEDDVDAANEAAAKAYEVAPQDPRAIAANLARGERELRERVRLARQRGAPRSQTEKMLQEWTRERDQLLAAAVQANPDHARLVSQYARVLGDEARQKAAEGQREEAERLLAEADAVIEKSLAANPGDALLHLAKGRHLGVRFDIDRENMSPEEARQLLASVDDHAARSLQLDPALYDAYLLRADLQLVIPGENGEPARPASVRYPAALDLLQQAAADTVSLWKTNLRARLTDPFRLRLLREGFTTAMRYLVEAEDQSAAQEILKRAEDFLVDAQTKYPEDPLTYYTQGELAVARGDRTEAIKAFDTADQKTQSVMGAAGFYWLREVRVPMLPSERLAALYYAEGQLGAAEQYADQALAQYEQEAGSPPPVSLVLLRAELYTRLEQYEPAHEFLEEYTRVYPENQDLRTRLAVVLGKLGRDAEAAREAAEVPATDVSGWSRKFRISVEREDYEGAEAALRAILDDPQSSEESRGAAERTMVALQMQRAGSAAEAQDYDRSAAILRDLLRSPKPTDQQWRQALRAYVAAMSEAERRDEARAEVESLLADPPREGQSLILRQHLVLVSEEDPVKRDEQLLALIAENPDPMARAQEYYTHYAGRENYARAAEYLVEMRKLAPGDMALLEREFRVRLVLGEFDTAAELLLELSRYDEGRGLDRVGGATYRGQLALARGEVENAIREYQVALRELPKNADLEVELARAYLIAGRSAEGLEALKRAAEINPRSFEAHRLSMLAYEQRAAQSFGAEQQEYEARVAEHLAQAEKLDPQHPDVLALRERVAQRDAPEEALVACQQRWREDPNDVANALRMGRLFARLGPRVAAGQAGASELRQQADAFFRAAIGKLTGPQQLRMAPNLAAYHAAIADTLSGEALLRQVVEAQVAPGEKVQAQLILARFFDFAGAASSAERSFQAAQRLAQSAEDPEQRKELERRVGLEFMGFYKRQRSPAQVVEVCRWVLDRLDLELRDQQTLRAELIEALLNAGRVADAEAEIDRYRELYGADDLAGLLARAQLRLLRNDRAGAEEDLNMVLVKNPAHGWARFARGTLALQRGKYEAARADLEEAKKLVRQTPLLLSVHDRLASLYGRTGELDLAERELRAQLELLEGEAASGIEMQNVLTKLVRLLYDRARQFDRAQRLISEYMERYPQDAIWPYEMGQLLESKAESEIEQARRAARRNNSGEERERKAAAKQACSAAAGYYARAAEKSGADSVGAGAALSAQMRALTKADRPREAITVFEGWPGGRPPPLGRLEAAKAYGELGEVEAARNQWEQALLETANYSSSAGRSVVAELRKALGDPAAEQMLRGLLGSQPEGSMVSIRLQLLLGGQLLASRQDEAALQALEQVTQAVRAGTPEQSEASLLYAQALQRSGQEKAAHDVYRGMLQTTPDSVVALNNLAYSLVTSEGDLYRPKEAKAYAERLWLLAGGLQNAATILDTVGWVYFKNDEPELAAAALEESLSLDSEGNPTAYLHLGEVYKSMGRTAEARTTLSRGLNLAESRDDQESLEAIPKFEEALRTLR